ncbi:MAG: glycosyltransferase [Muribaculaceae bacterium]
MNIIHLCPNIAWDDDARLTMELCKAHREMGHHVEVFVKRLRPVGDNFHEEGFLAGKLAMGGLFNFMAPLRLARHIDSLQGDVLIHCHSFKSALMALDVRSLLKTVRKVTIVMNEIDRDYSDARRRTADRIDRIISSTDMTNAKEVYNGLC